MIWGFNEWPRPRFVAGGGDALVFFEVCGEFAGEIEMSLEKYHSSGPPAGVEVHLRDNDFSRWDGSMRELLRESNPDAARAIESASQVMEIRGEISDPATLDYLRDVLGVVAALLDGGGIGVIEPQTLQLYAPQIWRETFWSGAFDAASHAAILLSPQDEKMWMHTRGMRLFGRPDLSCQGVLPAEVEKLQPVFNGLIRMQAAGAIIPDGQRVEAVGIENRLVCRRAGSLDDPEFNNYRLELEWEGARP